MSRDEVPAEVRALAVAAWDKIDPMTVYDEVIEEIEQAIMADRASRPAAPATDAEALEPFLSFAREHTNDDGWSLGTGKERICDWFGSSDFRALLAAYARPASAPQAVEEVRREAAQDERDRLLEVLEDRSGSAAIIARDWLKDEGAMLPADRQRARAGQDGGA